LAKSITLTRTAAASPGVIYNSITPGATSGPAAVTAVCAIVGGAGTTYKIRKVASALMYTWSVKSGANMIVTHENTAGGINDTAITVQYLSGFATDSIFVQSVNGCGVSVKRGIKVSATKPAAPASITGVLVSDVCGARVYRYSAPALVAATATAGAATGYLWTLPNGAVGSTGVLDSGNVNSRVIRVRYSSNAAAVAGDSIRVVYASTCGYTANKALKLANAVLNAPAAPASITIALVSDVCGARVYRYTAPVLPLATTTAGVATGYDWMMPFGAVGATGTIDSGTVNGRVIRIKYSSNAAASGLVGIGDSIKLRYLSGCGSSLYKTQKLSNVAKSCLISENPTPISKGFTETEASIFPNPTNDGNFKIQVKTGIAGNAKVGVEVLNEYGQKIRRFNLSSINGVAKGSSSIASMKPGVYYVIVFLESGNLVFKLIKSH
jgi:hypothetical protein